MKICSLVPLYSIISFITIVAPNTFVYLTPWLELFQAWALGSFFLLLCEFVSPSTQFRDVFFAALEVPRSRRAKGQQQDGLEWYRVSKSDLAYIVHHYFKTILLILFP